MKEVSKGFAKAETPFGPLAGHTWIRVSEFGEDSAQISFHCGHTPVSISVAGKNYHDLINALIEGANAEARADYNERLAGLIERTAGVA